MLFANQVEIMFYSESRVFCSLLKHNCVLNKIQTNDSYLTPTAELMVRLFCLLVKVFTWTMEEQNLGLPAEGYLLWTCF